MTRRLIRCKKCGKEKKVYGNRIKCCGVLQDITKDMIVLESAKRDKIVSENSESSVKNSSKNMAYHEENMAYHEENMAYQDEKSPITDVSKSEIKRFKHEKLGVKPFVIKQKPVQMIKTKEMIKRNKTKEEQQAFRTFIDEQEMLKQNGTITPEEYRKRVSEYIKEKEGETNGRTNDNGRRIPKDTERKNIKVKII